MRRRVDVRWSRRLAGGEREESIQVRRDGGPWETIASDAELPPDIDELLRLGSEASDTPLRQMNGFFRGDRTPARTRVSEPTGKDLEIVSEWRNPVVMLFAIGVVGLGFYGSRELQKSSWSSQAGGVAIVLLALALFYYALAIYFNRTTFMIRGGLLSIRHAPLPWFGHRELPVAAIDQLYVRYRRQHKGGGHYELWAHAHGRPIRLFEQGRSREEVMSIERAIERHLGIEDWPGWNAP